MVSRIRKESSEWKNIYWILYIFISKIYKEFIYQNRKIINIKQYKQISNNNLNLNIFTKLVQCSKGDPQTLVIESYKILKPQQLYHSHLLE